MSGSFRKKRALADNCGLHPTAGARGRFSNHLIGSNWPRFRSVPVLMRSFSFGKKTHLPARSTTICSTSLLLWETRTWNMVFGERLEPQVSLLRSSTPATQGSSNTRQTRFDSSERDELHTGIRVHYYCPSQPSRVVFGLHGMDRRAAEFRDSLVEAARRWRQLIVVPEFDQPNFPGVESYNYGNLLSQDGRLVPRSSWTFSLLDRIADCLSTEFNQNSSRYSLFGNSAGSQFVLRYLALKPASRVVSAVASNAGLYMLPDLGFEYPAGMGGVGLSETDLHRYLAHRLVILLGEEDTDENAADLPSGPLADAQGPHRLSRGRWYFLSRGRWYFSHCQRLAHNLGVPFGCRIETVPGPVI